MILFIFEGKKREPDIFKAIEKLFFTGKQGIMVCSYENTIYDLYTQLIKLGDAGDIVSIMREKYRSREDSPVGEYSMTSDFSEVYLFFDYDFHDSNLSIGDINTRLYKM